VFSPTAGRVGENTNRRQGFFHLDQTGWKKPVRSNSLKPGLSFPPVNYPPFEKWIYFIFLAIYFIATFIVAIFVAKANFIEMTNNEICVFDFFK